MPTKPKKRRTLDEVMKARFVAVFGEAQQRYPMGYSTLKRLIRQNRLEAFGNPLVIDTEHFEKQVRAGFPELEK